MITNINFTDIMTIIDPEKSKNNFNMNESERDKLEETKLGVIIQTIQSISTLSYIKKQPGVIKFLIASKVQSFWFTNGQNTIWE
jgi:hypothetical protein